MDRLTVRKAFKAIGYSVSFRRNPCNDRLCNLAFKNGEMIKPVVISSSNVYSADFRKAHAEAFDLAVSFTGKFLEDTEQKIC